MKTYDYFVLSGIKFITMEDFAKLKVGGHIAINYQNKRQMLLINSQDSVQNFHPENITTEEFVCFSNHDADQFMIATL